MEHEDGGDDGELMQLALELCTAAWHTEEEFLVHLQGRLADLDRAELEDLVARLATFGMNVVEEWALVTDRSPREVMQAIGLEVARTIYTR